MSHNVKTIIMLIVVVAIAVLAYKFLIVNNRAPGGPTVTSTSDTDAASREIALTLERLATLKIDKTIFTDEAFLSLEDFSIEVVEEERGRVNPFELFESEPELPSNKAPSVLRR